MVSKSSASKLVQGYAVFGNLSTLLEAHSCMLEAGGLLPPKVFLLKSSQRIATPLDAKRTALLKQLAPHAGWEVEFFDQLSDAEPVELSQLVGGPWQYVDVSQRALELAERDECEYLLGAKSEDQARVVLARLLEAGIRGIRVRPVLARRGENGSAELRVLWLVRGRLPPDAALKAAWRVWWGPVAETRQQNRIYVQCRTQSPVPPELLERIDRGITGAVVLLHSEVPQEVVIRPDPEAPATEELIHAAEVVAQRITPVVVAADTPAGLRFPVDLRLVSRPRPRSATERLRDLRLEIRIKQQACERLEEQVTEEDPYAPPFYEPLFLYIAPSGQVPEPLKKLLIECCDQAELRGLRYLRTELRYVLGPGDSAADPAAPPDELHLLATETALDLPARDGRHLWLREYQPSGRCTYRLLPEWIQHGLRLFLPDDDRRLEFFPDIQPGPVAAGKLAEGLLPPGAGDPQGYCVLLVPREGGPLTACSFKVSDFRPLVESFAWDCQLEVGPQPGPVVEGVGRREEQMLEQSTTAAFRTAVETTVTTLCQQEKTRLQAECQRENTRLEREKKRLVDQLQAAEKRLQGDVDRLRKLEQRLESHRLALETHAPRVDRAERAVAGLGRHCQSLLRLIAQTQQNYAAVRNVADQAMHDLRELADLLREASDLQKPRPPAQSSGVNDERPH